MRRVVVIAWALALAGCVPGTPLSPDYAGTWVAVSEKSCSEGAKIELSSQKITIKGGQWPLPMTLFSIQKADVTGPTAHLTMQLVPALDAMEAHRRQQAGQKPLPPDSEIRVTLTVRNDKITPSNMQVRDLKTGQARIRSREAEFATGFLTLRRCPA